MGLLFVEYLSGPRIYECSSCHAHLADYKHIISKGRHGRAYLVSEIANCSLGVSEERILITGLHTVADIVCNRCNSVVGWKYEHAHEESQKFKEGKYIIEKSMIVKQAGWQYD